MTTRVRQKKRGQTTRRRAKILLIGAEGDNKTETNYFNSFNKLLLLLNYWEVRVRYQCY